MESNRLVKILCVVCAAGCCLSSCGNTGEEKPKKLSSVSTGVTTTVTTNKKSAETITGSVTTIQTAATCTKIVFDGGYTLFANVQGGYTLINSSNEIVNSFEITDDNGDKLVLTCDGNTVTVTKNGKKVNSFSYKGTRIIISANEVYYANTKVTYVDESFSSFNVTDKVTIRCIAENKFEIVKDGKTVKKATVKDVNGSKYVLEAMDKGMEITNTDNELMESIVVGNNYISVSGDKVIINGKTMRPPHSADIKAVTTTVTEPVQEEQPSAPQPAEPTEPDSSTNMSNRNLSAETSEMLGYVNEVRKQYGLRELEGLELLDSAADVRANELLENYSHDRPDGNSYITAIEETDLPEWRAAAENIAYGMNSMTTVKEAFDAWMNSPPHRENILNPDVRYMACAKATKSDNGEYTYWEQLFYSDI
ncbi:CAP domain-containing protein [Ruminococcus bicirculans (ex Wegman et al. 2014)]|uniref:CAP domain-containing protein n=1 Tax=Ruminococcus bicirculans (ex Wegman et al. 2014) TaxID=1160721 RepID=UPI00241CBF3E|nr:CAP domain-containing protein [Ruminococcus bicirculans (ex Wegman et al. 2014)]